MWNLDPIGFALFVPSIICLLFTLQVRIVLFVHPETNANRRKWGGTTYAWNSAPIIALFVVFAVTLIAFVCSQIWLGEAGTGKILGTSQPTFN